MSVLVMYVLGAALFAATLFMIWYFIKSISIMSRYNLLLGIAGLILAPLSQLVFYSLKEKTMSDSDKKIFVSYSVSLLAISIILAISTIYSPPPM